MSRPKLGRNTALCAHAGCRKTLREGTWNWPTGLCVEHQPKPEVKVDTRKRIVMAHLVPGSSTLAASHPVSVPREPWL